MKRCAKSLATLRSGASAASQAMAKPLRDDILLPMVESTKMEPAPSGAGSILS